MNYTEYCNQEEPRKLNSFSVELTKNDCEIYTRYGKTYVSINFKGEWLQYVKGDDHSGLYTMDENGEKNKSSVFCLSELTCKSLLEGVKFKNKSGKYIQFPLRISDDFKWSPGETIEIQSFCESAGNNPEPGYIVVNLDYVGSERCFETAWISEVCLKENFIKIK